MNTSNNKKKTMSGIEMVRKLSEEGKRIFTINDARKIAPLCEISASYVVESLHYLVNNKWLIRLKKGLYAISSSFPGISPLHEFEIAMHLVSPATISHWSAMHFHGMTEQIPQRVYITTTQKITILKSDKRQNSTQKSYSRKINGIIYEFVKVKPERFFGIKEYWVGEAKVTITDPEKTLIDGLIAPKYFGDWAAVYSAFEAYISKIDFDRIVNYSLRFDTACVKRLGWILERLGVTNSILHKLESVPIKGYRVLDASGPKKGHCNKRWMIQENIPGKIIK